MRALLRQPQPALRKPGDGENKSEAQADALILRELLFVAAHIPFGLVLKSYPWLALIHAGAAFMLGLFWVMHKKQPYSLIYVCAYITGAELLWRVAGAQIFWEFGKYSVICLLGLSLVKHLELGKVDKLPVLYIILLLPSVFVLPEFNRGAVSFHLSGPLTLAVAVIYFSAVRLTKLHLRRILLALLAPIVAVAFLAAFSIISADSMVFGRSSNATAAAGFGPNQVSSILGLGAMAAFLIAVTMTTGAIYKILFLSCAAWLAAQSALTFSRGGLVGAASAILVASFYLVRDRNTRLAFLFGAGFIVLVSAYMVVPALNDFTGEALEERFTETHLTGRELIIKGDLLAFAENPWLGVGPGESREYHEIFFRSSQAHTEFTRLLAEHGLPGLVALSLLLLMVVRRFRAKLPPLEMAYAASFTTWALLFMTHAAMRMAAPGFLFGVAASFFVAYKVQKGVPAGQLAAYDRRQGSRLVLRRPGRAVLVSRPGAVGEGRPRLWGGG